MVDKNQKYLYNFIVQIKSIKFQIDINNISLSKGGIEKEEPKFATCPNCHEPVMPHRVCSNCGYYDGKQVVVKKETENA